MWKEEYKPMSKKENKQKRTELSLNKKQNSLL